MTKQELITLLNDIVDKIGHTKSCGQDMTMRGDDCWCGTKFNHLVHKNGKQIDEIRVREAIADLKTSGSNPNKQV